MYVKAIEAWNKVTTIPTVFVMLSTGLIRTNRRAGKKQVIYITMNKEQHLLALYSSLDCVPSSQLLQFEDSAENTEKKPKKQKRNQEQIEILCYTSAACILLVGCVILTRFVIMKSFHDNDMEVQQHISNPYHNCYFNSTKY